VAGQVVVEYNAKNNVSPVIDKIRDASKKLDQAFRGTTKRIGGSFNKLKNQATSLQGVLASVGAAAAVKGFVEAGVSADRTAKRLKFLGDQFGETGKLQAFATKSAEKFALGQTDAEKAVADLFGRLRPMGIELEDIETVFEGVNVAARQMSLSSADTAGVMLQLSQALGSGRLQGDEFRSIMERLPKIGQAVAKSMGMPIKQLKELSSQGKITTQEIVKALRTIKDEGFPAPDAVIKFNKAMSDLATAIGQKLTPMLSPVLNLISGLVTQFLNLPDPVQAAVIGFVAIAGAFAAIMPMLPIIAAGLSAIVAVVTGPVGIVAAIGGAIAGFVAMKSATEEAKQPIDEVNQKVNETKAAVEAAALAKEKFIARTKDHIKNLQTEKTQIEAQAQSFENSLKVTDARLQAESAINQMQRQSLEIAYEQAGSAKQRLEIAKRIFRNEVEAARVAFQQTMNSIEAEKIRLEFRRQAAQVELQIIQAKGELAAAEAESSEKAQLILEKTQKLADAQKKNIKMLSGQIKAQSKIAEHQTTAAKAQLKAAVQTAEQEFNQKLVSKEINMSRKQADKLSRSYGNSARASLNLSNNTMRVANNAQRTAQFFLKVQSTATTAANAIHKAAAAQERFNRAKTGKTSSSSTSNRIFPDTQQAEGGYNRGSFKAFARGGVVNGPTLGLIGEGGEREYIIPESKAAGFASNYLQGQRGASAIPGFAEGGTVGPINIQTGPVMQQNGQNFVTVEQFTQGMSDLASAITASSRSYGGRRYMGVV
jgi:tape measure domain-containing protein